MTAPRIDAGHSLEPLAFTTSNPCNACYSSGTRRKTQARVTRPVRNDRQPIYPRGSTGAASSETQPRHSAMATPSKTQRPAAQSPWSLHANALNLMAQRGETTAMKRAIDSGADINETDRDWFPLMMAV